MPKPEIELSWQAPPEKTMRRNSSMYDGVLAKVKASPGRWARIRTLKYNSAHSARQSILKLVADDERWEVTVARLEDNEELAGLWVRYRNDEQMKATQ